MIESALRWSEYEELIQEVDNRILWRQLINVIRALQRGDWLGNVFSLDHKYLYPRNILATIDDAGRLEITGIVDWDTAIFAPKFVALRAPFCAWAVKQYEEDANLEPTSYAGVITKRAFCEAASPEFKRMAFSQEGILARQLFDLLHRGMLVEVARDNAVTILEDWDQFFPNDHVYEINTE
jgi:hypothetical protein